MYAYSRSIGRVTGDLRSLQNKQHLLSSVCVHIKPSASVLNLEGKHHLEHLGDISMEMHNRTKNMAKQCKHTNNNHSIIIAGTRDSGNLFPHLEERWNGITGSCKMDLLIRSKRHLFYFPQAWTSSLLLHQANSFSVYHLSNNNTSQNPSNTQNSECEVSNNLVQWSPMNLLLIQVLVSYLTAFLLWNSSRQVPINSVVKITKV